jgi:hypothetical protein
MNCINNPTKTAGFFAIGMNPVMALAAQSGEMVIAAQPLAASARLVVDVLALFIFATLTAWVEGKIRFLCLGILFVFTLALGGCIPQPSAALEALRSFQGSF